MKYNYSWGFLIPEKVYQNILNIKIDEKSGCEVFSLLFTMICDRCILAVTTCDRLYKV
ncbi:hypothetical protein [Nostoc cycadae]|uniref:hypothetical protein n=1 Tax=Nostoc cycadae TaxID=246795 RepID=UPI001651787C|nr:hypothetical protein [Nostoc cycadae]